MRWALHRISDIAKYFFPPQLTLPTPKPFRAVCVHSFKAVIMRLGSWKSIRRLMISSNILERQVSYFVTCKRRAGGGGPLSYCYTYPSFPFLSLSLTFAMPFASSSSSSSSSPKDNVYDAKQRQYGVCNMTSCAAFTGAVPTDCYGDKDKYKSCYAGSIQTTSLRYALLFVFIIIGVSLSEARCVPWYIVFVSAVVCRLHYYLNTSVNPQQVHG